MGHRKSAPLSMYFEEVLYKCSTASLVFITGIGLKIDPEAWPERDLGSWFRKFTIEF